MIIRKNPIRFTIIKFLLFFGFITIILVSCRAQKNYVPVLEARISGVLTSWKFYRVRSGDTLYSIAWAFNMNYRELTQLNRLHRPYHIHPGQTLRLTNVVPMTYHENRFKADRSSITRVSLQYNRSLYSWN